MNFDWYSFKRDTFEESTLQVLKMVTENELSEVLHKLFKIQSKSKDNRVLPHYEKLIVLCWSDPQEYVKNKLTYLLDIIKVIHSKNLYGDFLELFGYIYPEVLKSKVYDFLFTELSDIMDLIYIQDGKYLIGVDYDGSPLTIDRPRWRMITKASILYARLKKSNLTYEGYKKEMLKDSISTEAVLDDVRISRILCLTGQYINPKTLKMIPREWMLHEKLSLFDTRLINPTKYYIERLRERDYILNKKGVLITFQYGTVLRDLLLMESTSSNDETLLLAKFGVCDIKGESIAAYNTVTGEFLSVFSRSDLDKVEKFDRKLKNFILEVYTELTCDNYKRHSSMGLSIEDGINYYTLNVGGNILYSVEVFQKFSDYKVGSKRRKKFTQKPHRRDQTIRKLPEGWKRSEQAEALALQHGIRLKEGETYVSAYSVGKGSIRESKIRRR